MRQQKAVQMDGILGDDQSPGGGDGQNYHSRKIKHCQPPVFPFETNLPGLLAQAADRKRRAERQGDNNSAVDHLSIWLTLHPLIVKHSIVNEVRHGANIADG